jgi:putative colanic acid biosynthesis acetyltransferase WcaF
LTEPLDPIALAGIKANRRATKWSRRELALRLIWEICQPLFRLSPRQFWVWRRMLLRAFGASIGNGVHIHPTAKIFAPWALKIGDQSSVGDGAILYNLGPLTIGAAATSSQGAHLCGGTHDHRDPTMPLVKAAISVGNRVWVCADAFVGPDVTIGDGAILAARAVVIKPVSPDVIVGGNPAVLIKLRSGGALLDPASVTPDPLETSHAPS